MLVFGLKPGDSESVSRAEGRAQRLLHKSLQVTGQRGLRVRLVTGAARARSQTGKVTARTKCDHVPGLALTHYQWLTDLPISPPYLFTQMRSRGLGRAAAPGLEDVKKGSILLAVTPLGLIPAPSSQDRLPWPVLSGRSDARTLDKMMPPGVGQLLGSPRRPPLYWELSLSSGSH